MRKLIPAAFLAFLFTCVFAECQAKPAATQITLYNQGTALVRELRTVHLLKGLTRVDIADIPSQIDPASVFIESISHPDAVEVLEQNFTNTTVGQSTLLDEYLGKEVAVAVTDPVTHQTRIEKAILVSEGTVYDKKSRKWCVTGNPVVAIGGNLYLKLPGEILFPPVQADGFAFPSQGAYPPRARPVLSWQVKSPVAGDEQVALSYITGGMDWKADYVAVVNPGDSRLTLNGWVTITNNSGSTFRNASLRLVAGNVNMSQSAKKVYALDGAAKTSAEAPSAFAQSNLFEYHMYTLHRRTTLPNGTTKQIRFLSRDGISVKKILVYDGSPSPYGYYWDNQGYRENPDALPRQSSEGVHAMLEFFNGAKNNLGIPLPQGTVRVYQESADGAMALIGQDQIQHTPRNENVSLYLGNAFDLVGTRKQVSFEEITPHHVYDETFEIQLRNHKDSPENVRVVEHLWRWNAWSITKASHAYKKLDARTIEFPVAVPANGETTVTYTVRYTW